MHILAQVNGEGLIHTLWVALLVGICIGIVYAVGRWFITKLFPGFPMALMIWNGLFILIGAALAINFVMSLAGHPLVRW